MTQIIKAINEDITTFSNSNKELVITKKELTAIKNEKIKVQKIIIQENINETLIILKNQIDSLEELL